MKAHIGSEARLGLAIPKWVENRPFSFDSHVATIEHRKIVMQPTCCITFPCPKPTISRILINLIILPNPSPTLTTSAGGKNGYFDYVISPNFIGLRILIKEMQVFQNM